MRFLLFLFFLPVMLSGQQKTIISLHGIWQFQIDSLKVGEAEQWYNRDLPLSIKLPGSTDEGGFGKVHVNGTPLYDGQPEIYRLARKHVYIGAAWYRKEISLPLDWKNKRVFLSLERCMWQTKIWVNGKYAGENNSLCTPHHYEISKFLNPGKNIISIRVDNSPQINLGSWSHGYSPEIQTIWNGVIGKIEISAVPSVHIQDVQVFPSFEKQLLTVKLKINNPDSQKLSGLLKFTIKDKDAKILSYIQKVDKSDALEPLTVVIPLEGRLKPWNEFTPQLYQLQIEASLGKAAVIKELTFGVRDLKTENGRFVLNGNKLFLRGEHDAGSFPLTGYPSMDKADWIRIFQIGKSYGLNHWRFHSWCPPEAAFEAADETGIIIQAELPLFSQPWEHSLVGTDPARDEFLKSELKRILDTYGNHPSFGLMCMGNELKGDPKVMQELVAFGKKYDPRHLYAGTANLEAIGVYERLEGDDYQVAHAGKYQGKRFERRMKDYFSAEIPNTQNDYAYTLNPPYNEWPIISHEVGQWTVFPDFREIEKYTGVLAPRNLEVFQSRLQQKGMLDQAKDFVMASGKLSALLYREEIERLLRTPGMGGFQLLDLHDYPGQGSALVGLLNQFWESKGLITPEEFRGFCNDVTLLLKMPKRTWLNNENFSASLVVPNYSISEISDIAVKWKVTAGDVVIKEGILEGKTVKQGEVNKIGELSFNLSTVSHATKLNITLEEPNLKVKNAYEIWVYPSAVNTDIPDNITLATTADSTLLKKITNGATVLLVTDKLPDTERMTFTTPFWSTILFDYQVKTMGILCKPDHPVFKNFPTDFYSNWQWWELTNDARVLRLNKTAPGYRPILQVIDHPVRNDKLGAIVETKIGKGKLLLCTLDVLSDPQNRYVARQLLKSILTYMSSPDFDPQENKELAEIIFSKANSSASVIQSVKSSPENSESPSLFAFDSDLASSWKIAASDTKVSCVIELNVSRLVMGCTMKLTDQDFNPAAFTVYVTDNPEDLGEPVITGEIPGNEVFEAKQWDNGFTIQKGKKGKFIILEIKPQKQNKAAIRVNEIQWIFGD